MFLKVYLWKIQAAANNLAILSKQAIKCVLYDLFSIKIMLFVYPNFYYPLDFTDFISGYLFNYFKRNWNLIHELLTVTPKSFLTANLSNEDDQSV